MPLTKEQLLQNRYKFIAPYPGSHWVVGDILELVLGQEGLYKGKSFPTYWIRETILKEYPHIFQPLPWWSDREISDLPEYVKRIDSSVVYSLKVDYNINSMWLDDCEFTLNLVKYEPAILEEHNAYINQKKQ